MARVVLKDKIMYNMEIQNVSQLAQVCSGTSVISGLEWSFEIEKLVACQEENRVDDTISVSLCSNIPDDRKDYMCGAHAKVTLVSYKNDKQSHRKCISGVFDAENTIWGLDCFIKWKDLFIKGFIQDDTVVFEMELKVGSMEYKGCNSLILKTIEDKYEGEKVTEKLLEIILNRIDDDFVATKSKVITFNGLQWHIVVGKSFKNEKKYFTVTLLCDNEQSSDDWSCELWVTLKMIPVNADSAPIEKCFNLKFDENNKLSAIMNSTEWSALEHQFVKRKAIEMMLGLKVKKDQ